MRVLVYFKYFKFICVCPEFTLCFFK